MSIDNFGDEPVIILEDHLGSTLAGEVDKLPQVVAAFEDLRANPTKLDKLHQVLTAEIAQRQDQQKAGHEGIRRGDV